MSNYLNNLVARSTGLAEEFRPRLPSLFEPASGGTGSSSISRYHLEDAQIEDSEKSVNQGERQSDAGAPDRPVRGAMVVRQRAQLEDEPGPFQQSRMQTAAAAHRAVESAEPGGEAQPPNRQPGKEMKARAARPGDPSDSRVERHQEKPDARPNARAETATTEHGRSALSRQAPMLERVRNEQRSVDQGVQAKAATGVAGQSLDQPADQRLNRDHSPLSRGYSSTELETVDNGRIENGPPTTYSAAATTYSEAADRRAVTPASLRAQPASTIKVTIGRVEVRAIVNESQPRRPESVKAKPRMTLDEYLKQRNGGQR